MPLLFLLGSVLLASLAIACGAEGPGQSPTFNRTPTGEEQALQAGEVYRTLSDDWQRTPAVDELITLAQEEGEVLLRGYSYNQAQLDAWCEGFTEEFGIECQGRGLPSGQTVTTLASEASAGQQTTDVVYLSMSQMAEYLDRGLAGGVDWSALGVDGRRAWDTDDTSGEGGAVGVVQSQYTHFVNTDYVDAEEVPRTVFDWLDPKWEGLVCSPDFLLRAGNGFLALYYDKDDMVELHRQLIESNSMVVTEDCDAFLLSGERPLSYMDYGYPPSLVEAENIQPFWNPGMGVNLFSHAVAENAPNPHAARLFAAWSTSREASRLSWEAIGDGWAAYGHGPEDLVSGRFADLDLIYESPATFEERGEMAQHFSEQVFDEGQ